MKKFFLAMAALVMSAAMMSAQDLATATQTYNNGAEQLGTGDKVTALASFKEALGMAETLGDEGKEIVENCKKAISSIVFSNAKDLVKESNYDEALAMIDEAKKFAEECGNDDVLEDAAKLVPQVKLAKANHLNKEKDYAAAKDILTELIAEDPTNKNANILLIQTLTKLDDIDGAVALLPQAEELGNIANAKKTIGQALLAKAQAQLKAGKNADVVETVKKAEELDAVTNPAIYQLAGGAATKLNRINDAISFYEKFLEAAPTNKNYGAIAYTVGALYQQNLKNNAKALEYYKKSLDAGYANAKQMVDALSK